MGYGGWVSLPPHFVTGTAQIEQIDELAELVRTASLAESGRNHFTREELVATLTAPGMKLDRDTLTVRDDAGALVGLEWLSGTAPFVRFHTTGFVAPERLGQGIGTYLLEWARDLALRRLGEAAEGARVSLSAGVDTKHQPSMDLMRGAGWSLVRYFLEMRIDFAGEPAAPTLPAGIMVRTFVPGADDILTYQAIDEAFRDHYGFVERPLEAGLERLRHRMSLPTFDPSLWWVAREGDTVVGACLCEPSADGDETIGYVGSLSVRRPWRSRGLAKALLLNAFGELFRRGRKAVTLHVDAQNLTGATGLYEAVGMKESERYAAFETELRPGEDLAVR